MDLRDRFAANLKRVRERVGLTQEELGFHCDLHRTEISLLERARREPRLSTVVKLSSALGVSVESLCDGMAWDVEGRRFELEK